MQKDPQRDGHRILPESSESSEDSSSSSSEESEGAEEVPEPDQAAAGPFTLVTQDTIDGWRPGCDVWQNKKSKTLHLRAKGSTGQVFVCGRKLTEDFTDFNGRSVYSNAWKCKQCNISRPIKDVGAMASMLERITSKPKHA